jgi:hypothetical protein
LAGRNVRRRVIRRVHFVRWAGGRSLRKNANHGILAAERTRLTSSMSQLVGSGSGVMVVDDFTWLVTAPLGPVVVLVALDSTGLE